MNLHDKTIMILRQAEWAIIYQKENKQQGWLNNIIDKTIYQNILDPLRLMIKSTGEILKTIAFWYFIFYLLLVFGFIIFVKFYQLFPNISLESRTLNYTILLIFLSPIFFTYFIFTFRVPSAIKQSFVNKDNANLIVASIKSHIKSEKEADLIDKNLSDLAELAKQRRTIVRVISVLAIAFIFKEKKFDLTLINTGTTMITIAISILFEMYALGSRAVFANAKLAIRKIALLHNERNTSNKI